MEVASLELCKELFELSGWVETYFKYRPVSVVKGIAGDYQLGRSQAPDAIPAYDLGYLLRKLPVEKFYKLMIDNSSSWSLKTNEINRIYWFRAANGERLTDNYDTPEDAACKLAIELLKQGILSGVKGDNHNV